MSRRHGTDLANSAKINAMFIAIAFTMNMAYNSKRGSCCGNTCRLPMILVFDRNRDRNHDENRVKIIDRML